METAFTITVIRTKPTFVRSYQTHFSHWQIWKTIISHAQKKYGLMERLTDNRLIFARGNPELSRLTQRHRLSVRHSARHHFRSPSYPTSFRLHARKAFVSLHNLTRLQSRPHASVRDVIHIHKQIDFFFSILSGLRCDAPESVFPFDLGNKVWFMAREHSFPPRFCEAPRVSRPS